MVEHLAAFQINHILKNTIWFEMMCEEAQKGILSTIQLWSSQCVIDITFALWPHYSVIIVRSVAWLLCEYTIKGTLHGKPFLWSCNDFNDAIKISLSPSPRFIICMVPSVPMVLYTERDRSLSQRTHNLKETTEEKREVDVRQAMGETLACWNQHNHVQSHMTTRFAMCCCAHKAAFQATTMPLITERNWA